MINYIWKKRLVFVIIAMFMLTSVIPIIIGEGEEYFYAHQDIPVSNGGISGDYTDTFSSDDNYEVISERESGGKPSNRYSFLEHKWIFQLTGSYTSINFYIEAYHTANSEGDNFVFSYSTDDLYYIDLLTVIKTSDDDTIQVALLPNSITGNIYIRVKDVDQTPGRKTLDIIYIDYMYLLAITTPDVTPPIIFDIGNAVGYYAGIEILTAYSGGSQLDIWEKQSDGWIDNGDINEPYSYRFKIGDLDGDSENEIVIINNMYLFVYEYEAGIFNKVWYTPINSVHDVDIGDVDNDGLLEIVTGQDNNGHARVYKYINNTYELLWIQPGTGFWGFSCRVGDITNDGRVDFVANNLNTILVWENDTNGGFVNTFNISGAGNCDNIDIGDVDNDNENELIFCGADNKVHLVEWNGNGFDETWCSDDMGMYIQDCGIGDVDTDGYNEIVGGGEEMYVWEKQFGGWILSWSSIGYGGGSINGMKNINVLDVDGDGKNEFTSAAGGITENWYIWGYISGNSYGEEFDSGPYGESITVGVGDADNDGGIQVTISWVTDELSNSVVNYGTTTELGYSAFYSSFVTNHQIIIDDLLSNTTYFFEVQSTDASDNTATDDNNGDYYTFTTFFRPEITDIASSVNDDTWNKQSPSYSGGVLYPRELFAMTYNSGADRTILFGGSGGNSRYNDTWAYNYNTNTWVNRSPNYSNGTLAKRIVPGFTYNSDADRTILFGGWGDTMYHNDTWAYDYNTNMWINRSPSIIGGNLTPRYGVMMAYYDSVDCIIMFGGFDVHALDETWEYNYNTNTWTKLIPTVEGGSLPSVGGGAIVYDSTTDLIILFGGSDGYSDYNETWIYCYHNNTWWKRNPDFVGGTLTKQSMQGMVYDSSLDRTILFGGSWQIQYGKYRPVNETWTYDYGNNTWYNMSFNVFGDDFYRREAMGLVYDSSSDKTIMACGFAESPVNFLNDTWLLKMDDYTAIITWITDEPSDSVVNYGTTTALGNTTSDSTLVTNHQIILTDLQFDKTYYYEVQSTDQDGNTATDDNNGSYFTFTTEKDTTPPVISNIILSEITHNSAKITWDTDEQSNSKVNYGITIALGDTISNSAMVTSHSIVLTDLLPETSYYYEVQSTDIEGNTATDDNNGNYYSFITDSAPNNVMHVYSIDMWYEKTGKNYKIYTKVKIVDSIDNSINGAMVYIKMTLPDNSEVSYNDVTGIDGTVTFMYGSTKQTGTYTSLVTNVVKDGWTYDPDYNVETSEQLQVP